jgi:ADP-heptose:LPS heptosyltransferase
MSHLGDVVSALPVFHALRAAFPSAEIAWVVQSEFASLLEGMPGLARAIRFDRPGGWRAWLALRDELAVFAPDLAIDAQANSKSALAMFCTGAARRVGLARRDGRERIGALALTEHARPVASGEAHAMHKMRALCEHFGASSMRCDPALTAGELELGRARCAELFHGNARGAVAIQVAAPGDVRSWPLARQEALARSLGLRGVRVAMLSGPGEAEQGRELASRLAGAHNVEHWIDQRGLRELAAFFAAAGLEGARFAGCDSGPMHLAAACGLPVVVLSGPQSHLRTGPWPIASTPGSPHSVVRAREQPSCAPCLRRDCTHPRGPVCMSELDELDVIAALVGSGAAPS